MKSDKGIFYGWTLRVCLLLLTVHALTILFSFDNAFLTIATPIIADSLHLTAPEWLGDSFLIATTAFLPLANGLSKIYGRRDPLLVSILLFMIGSTVSATAHSQAVVLIGRVLSGMASAGISTIGGILITDVLPLTSRGLGIGVVFAGWAAGYSIGPVVAGALGTNWRWNFWILVPIGGLCAILLLFTAKGLGRTSFNTRERWKRIDWLGNLIGTAAVTSFALGFTWAGSQYSWQNAAVLVPICGGAALFAVYVVYERRLEHPTLPFDVFARGRTVCIGYVGCFVHLFIQQGAAYATVIYLQSVKLKAPLPAAIGTLAFLATGQLFGVIVSVWVNWRKSWKWENVFAYFCLTFGCVFIALLKADTPTIGWVGSFIVAGFGSGALNSLEDYPTLAPLPQNLQGDGTAFIVLANNVGQFLGLSITVNILQTRLLSRLPEAFIAQVGDNRQLLFSSISVVQSLSEPLQGQVQSVFAEALQVLFLFFAALSGVMTLLCCFYEHTDLHEEADAQWGFQQTASGSTEAIELERTSQSQPRKRHVVTVAS